MHRLNLRSFGERPPKPQPSWPMGPLLQWVYYVAVAGNTPESPLGRSLDLNVSFCHSPKYCGSSTFYNQ